MWWRGAIVASILGLWLAIGIAWGGIAALIFGFFVLIACINAAWMILAAGVDRRFAGWYYEHLLRPERGKRR